MRFQIPQWLVPSDRFLLALFIVITIVAIFAH